MEREALKNMGPDELRRLCADLRSRMVATVLETGGHLSASLGAVELTVALHRVFDTPRDLIVWDVGHQSYAHKLLTDRAERFETLRHYGGLSGFPDPDESEHDAFVGGHAGNAISAALGLAMARDCQGGTHDVVAVVGDGSLTAGMSYEALNHAGHYGSRLIILLNDNGMSISPTAGGLARRLHMMRTGPRYGASQAEDGQGSIQPAAGPAVTLVAETSEVRREDHGDSGDAVRGTGHHLSWPGGWT